MTETRLNNRQWLAKFMAALVPGALLSFGAMAVVGTLCHTTGDIRTVSAQFLMWMAVLVWLALLGSCFLFRSGARAWAVLGGAALLVWGVFGVLTKVIMA
ncbi:hypothetical protein GOB86_13070 [Acetobacter lambici]|uniref:Iron uptake protein n=1 Tax=Acetobacter lambici TaxID=1332824 RepID=A0ABT1F3H4_9PROT|nr:hypothetical protein [Acetobacter lambici]MCP1243697.1 hypothetical protein [Acetobacter lambici]MCP1259757.1 hypothetical protein [Acetobacter lambici]NHO57970.1 hypothetical protein [Acetobacter lambici]